jgi:hypothetical protein
MFNMMYDDNSLIDIVSVVPPEDDPVEGSKLMIN